jgi:hypothetical protein
MTVLAPPLAEISERARPYPADLLPEGGTALALFSAAFLGHNDAIHFARKNMTGTCVDIDTDKLEQMRQLYPPGWKFITGDAWEYAISATGFSARWDAVSVDTFTGEAMIRSLASLELWCELARKVVTVTITDGHPYEVPEGWHAMLYPRSNDVNWLVLTR